MRVARSSRRARVAAACVVSAALALALAACGSTSASNNQAVTVSGSTLSIYTARPPAGTDAQVASDVIDAERLAFDQAGARLGHFHLRFGVVHAGEVSQDARDVISDKTSIAYLGEIPPGTSGVSLQITNQLGLLQVSPTDTAAYLTKATPAVADSPQHFYPAHSNFSQTFARVVPTTVAESKRLVARMKSDGVTRLQVADDGTDYGRSVAAEVRSDASAAGLSNGSGGAYLYAGMPSTAATRALDAAVARSHGVKLYAPSALYDDGFVTDLSSAAQRALTVSAPGFMPGGLDGVGHAFVASFRHRYGHTPAPQAIFGYEAMRALIAVLKQAGAHAVERQTVVGDFRDLKRTADESALGAYTINGGDTNIAPFVFAGVSGGKLVPRAAG